MLKLQFSQSKLDSKHIGIASFDSLTGHYFFSWVVPFYFAYERYYFITKEEYDSFESEQYYTLAQHLIEDHPPARFFGQHLKRTLVDSSPLLFFIMATTAYQRCIAKS